MKASRNDSNVVAGRGSSAVIARGTNTVFMIAIKREYDPPGQSDGARVLVDRLWPRGLRKPDLRLSRWMQEVAPSDELRGFFGHDPARWREFRKRYLTELECAEMAQPVAELIKLARRGKLVLVYGAKDQLHNHAVVLKELLDKKLKSG
jgi:uncharacterized protein YeaO (DUF488 family)